jgi:hypothetical protein
MKKQILSIAILILISASAAFSQSVEQQVAKIRNLANETNKRIDAGLKDKTSGFHYAAWTIGGERDGQPWAAVGNMKTTDEFWFDGEPGMGDEEGKVDARRAVRKIVSAYAGAADLRNRSEYLLGETGELVFAFTSELDPEGKTMERRFYFAKGKLIRVVIGGKNIDRNFGNEDAQLAANAMTDAKRLQNLFALMFAEE